MDREASEEFYYLKYSFRLWKKNEIASSATMDKWTKDWKMKLPDIVFDKTCLEISKKDSQNRLQIGVEPILQYRCKENEFDPLKINVETLQIDSSIPVYSDGYHWAFPSFTGACGYSQNEELPTEERIPWDELKIPYSILWSTHFILYEDHLHDFGHIVCYCKIRVMENFFYILLRTYLRIDHRCVYLIDHRYFHSFMSKSIIHEFSLQKLDWNSVDESKRKLLFGDPDSIGLFSDLIKTEKVRYTAIPL